MTNTIETYTFDWTDSSSKYLSEYDIEWLQHETDLICKYQENSDGTYSATIMSNELNTQAKLHNADEDKLFDDVERMAKHIITTQYLNYGLPIRFSQDEYEDFEEDEAYWQEYDMQETAAIERFYGVE